MSDIIYTPPVSSGGGVNPTSTYMPVNIGGTFVDSIIQCLPNTFAQSMRGASGFGFGTNISGTSCESFLGDPNNQIDGIFLQVKNDTTSSRIFTANRGLYLDYVINRYIFGDWANIYNGVTLNIDDQNRQVAFTDNNVIEGLFLNYTNNTYSFGSITTTSYLSIDASNYFFNLYLNGTNCINFDFSGNGIGYLFVQQYASIYFDGATRSVNMGDYNNNGNYGATLICNDNTGQIVTKFQNSSFVGMKFDFPNAIFAIGDYSGLTNFTYFEADIPNKTITISGDNLIINSNTSTSAGGPSLTGYLVVKVNGVNCKIQLLDP